jgi:hypothetical protein
MLVYQDIRVLAQVAVCMSFDYPLHCRTGIELLGRGHSPGVIWPFGSSKYVLEYLE